MINANMRNFILFCVFFLYKEAFSQFEFGISYTNGITKTYNNITNDKNIAPTFKVFNFNKYLWGVLFDFKVYKNLYIKTGAEHKPMHVGVSQDIFVSDLTRDKFNVLGVSMNNKSGWGYWSFPLRLSYRQPIYKGIYISPNFGFSYLYKKNDKILQNIKSRYFFEHFYIL